MRTQRTAKQTARESGRPRPPFWVPAGGYYVLSFLLAFLVFLAFWSLLVEGGDEAPAWAAALPSMLVVAVTVFIREVVLRRARRKFLTVQRQLDVTIGSAKARVRGSADVPHVKLTSKQNSELVSRIKRKSDAAKELMSVARGHLEVFELCTEYLDLNKTQIEMANPGSPRLQDLRQGREYIKKLHHFHLLSWAEIESKTLTKVAADCGTISGKSSYLRDALRVLDSALDHYPNDPALTESETAVRDLLFSVEISSRIEIAEREAFLGEYDSAVRTLTDAIEYIDADGRPTGEREALKKRLELEIHRFRNHSRMEWENGEEERI